MKGEAISKVEEYIYECLEMVGTLVLIDIDIDANPHEALVFMDSIRKWPISSLSPMKTKNPKNPTKLIFKRFKKVLS